MTSVFFSHWIIFPTNSPHHCSFPCASFPDLCPKLLAPILLLLMGLHWTALWVPSKFPPNSTQDKKLEFIPNLFLSFILLSHSPSLQKLIDSTFNLCYFFFFFLPLLYFNASLNACLDQWIGLCIIQSSLNTVIKNICNKDCNKISVV